MEKRGRKWAWAGWWLSILYIYSSLEYASTVAHALRMKGWDFPFTGTLNWADITPSLWVTTAVFAPWLLAGAAIQHQVQEKFKHPDFSFEKVLRVMVAILILTSVFVMNFHSARLQEAQQHYQVSLETAIGWGVMAYVAAFTSIAVQMILVHYFLGRKLLKEVSTSGKEMRSQ